MLTAFTRAGAVTGAAALLLTAAAQSASAADFEVTAAQPTAAQLNALVQFLVATDAPDSAKAHNVEGGMSSVVVPRTVYTLGLFRAPRGASTVSGPVTASGENAVTANLTAHSAGIPSVNMPVEFKRIDGNWRLASSSMCSGVKAVGLPIFCNA